MSILDISDEYIDKNWDYFPPHKVLSEFHNYSIKKSSKLFCISGWELNAGDVVLSRNDLLPSKGAGWIQWYQSKMFGPEDCKWTHVGIIDQHHTVWEAMPNANIKTAALTQVMRESSHLAFVRIRPPVDPQLLH